MCPESPPVKCRTVLISDAPAIEDAFGSHERIANAVCDLVRSEPGGRTIAIEGIWGAGKSTVVNLIRRKLDDDHNRVVVFDAWAHEGDPLRRSFLEKVIGCLLANREQWIAQDKWTHRREELARRRKVTRTTDWPSLTGFAKLMIGGIFLVPVGIALLSSTLEKGGQFVTGVILSGVPLLILITLFFLTRSPIRNIASRKWKWLKQIEETDSAWALLVNRTVERTQSETVETPDPTSVEFEQTFAELIEEALSSPYRRLILVVDNLDRVAPSDALAIWATLGTFFQNREHDCPPWLERLWVVLPYDQTGIQRLWGKNGDDQRRTDRHVAETILDKTIQARFEVPLPVLSDWRAFLIRLLEQAFPEHDRAEFHAVYRVFATSLQEFRSPTPRDLKLYVNAIGVYHRLWGDTFALADVAYYTQVRKKGMNVAGGLIAETLPEPATAPIVSESIRDNLAALSFGVDVNTARQLLIREPLVAALGSANSTRFEELSKHPGFWEAVETIDFSIWKEREAVSLANAAACLVNSGVLLGATRSEATSVIKAIRDAASGVGRWPPLNQKIAAGLGALCKLVNTPTFTREMFLRATSSAPGSAEGQGSDDWGPWIKGLLVLLSEIQSLGSKDVYADGVVVPGDAADFIRTCTMLHREDTTDEFRAVLRPEVPLERIVGALSELPVQGEFLRDELEAVKVMRAANLTWPWDSLTASLSDRLQGGRPVPCDEVEMLLETLWRLGEVAKQHLRQLVTGGHLLHHYHGASSGKHLGAAVWCVALYLREIPSVAQPPVIGNSMVGYKQLAQLLTSPQNWAEFPGHLVALLKEIKDFDLVFRLLEGMPTAKPFVAACVEQASQDPDPARLFPPAVFVERWRFVREALDGSERASERFDGLTARLVETTGLAAYLQEFHFDLKLAGLYSALVRSGAGSEFSAWCGEELKAIDGQRWEQELKSEGELAELVVDLTECGNRLELGLTYKDGMVAHAKALIAGDKSPRYLKDFWHELVQLIANGGSGRVFRRELYEAVATRDGNISACFFEIYGKEISDIGVLKQESNAVLRLFSPIVKTRNAKGLEWLADVLEANKDLLESYPQDTVDDFRGRIEASISPLQQDDAEPQMLRIAKVLGIEAQRTEEMEQKQQKDD